jgi:hypothetical protein
MRSSGRSTPTVFALRPVTTPASTLLGVTVLGYPDQLVEVEAVAALR